jgi:anti-sigma factor RsiW
MSHQCTEIVSLLMDFVDGTLPPDREDEFRRHLCGCMPCYIYLETYQETIRRTRSLPDCAMPPEMQHRLESMLKQSAP